MSKVSYEPNNTKNGHLGAKLEPIENWKFPKNRFHTPKLGDTVVVWNSRILEKFEVIGENPKWFEPLVIELLVVWRWAPTKNVTKNTPLG